MDTEKGWWFLVDQEQITKYNEWYEKHISTCLHRDARTAIGGDKTFSFTSTSIGQVLKVKCSCNEEVDLSDYENW